MGCVQSNASGAASLKSKYKMGAQVFFLKIFLCVIFTKDSIKPPFLVTGMIIRIVEIFLLECDVSPFFCLHIYTFIYRHHFIRLIYLPIFLLSSPFTLNSIYFPLLARLEKELIPRYLSLHHMKQVRKWP